MSKNASKSALDNRANQLNPIHPAFHSSRGASPGQAQTQAAAVQHELEPTVAPAPEGNAHAGSSAPEAGAPSVQSAERSE